MKNHRWKWRTPGAVVCAVLITSACAMPDTFQVRAGLDPRSADDEVRFRTNYYYTVLNLCYDKDGNVSSVPGLPEIDAVYRYQMTGKANALFTKTRFEAGLLAADAIDPLGAGGERLRDVFESDAGNGNGAETKASTNTAGAAAPAASAGATTATGQGNAGTASSSDLLKDDALKAALEEAADKAKLAFPYADAALVEWRLFSAALSVNEKSPLGNLRDALVAQGQAAVAASELAKDETAGPDKWEPVLTTYIAAIKATSEARAALTPAILAGAPDPKGMDDLIENLQEFRSVELSDALAPLALHNRATQIAALMTKNASLQKAVSAVGCLDGSRPRQGFLILGPEGWRFKSSARLAMAMTTGADPLIESLNKVTALSRSDRQGGAERLLPVSNAETQALDLILRGNAATEPDDMATFLKEAASELSVPAGEDQ